MFIFFCISILVGVLVGAFSGIGILGLIVGCVFFIGGLPFALVAGIINSTVSYTQDRADYRQHTANMTAREIAEEQKESKTYNDNRQIHYYSK